MTITGCAVRIYSLKELLFFLNDAVVVEFYFEPGAGMVEFHQAESQHVVLSPISALYFNHGKLYISLPLGIVFLLFT